MLIFGFVLTVLGTWLLNSHGSYTEKVSAKVFGWAVNAIALLAFVIHYGVARGIFVYLGVWAFIGMTITFLLPVLTNKK